MSAIGIYRVRWTEKRCKELSVVSSRPTTEVQTGYGWSDANKLVISSELNSELFNHIHCNSLRREIKTELFLCAQKIAALLNKKRPNLEVIFSQHNNSDVIVQKGQPSKHYCHCKKRVVTHLVDGISACLPCAKLISKSRRNAKITKILEKRNV